MRMVVRTTPRLGPAADGLQQQEPQLVARSYGDVARFRAAPTRLMTSLSDRRAEEVVGSLSGAGRIRTRDTRVKSPLL
jgi:hypothetical protein